MLGKSPAWQDADGACSRLSRRGGRRLRCCSTAAAACSPSCARFVDYVDVDAVVISHLHADHILDLVPFASGADATRRASSRSRSTAGRAPTTRRARGCSRRRARRDAFRRAVRGAAACARSTSSSAFALSEYDPADDGRRSATLDGPLPARPALHPDQRGRARRATARRFTYCADCAPSDDAVRVRARHRPAADRGHAAAARARGPARPPDARARPASTAARAGARRLVLTHFSDELDADWARARGRARRSAGRSTSPTRAPSTTSERVKRGPLPADLTWM